MLLDSTVMLTRHVNNRSSPTPNQNRENKTKCFSALKTTTSNSFLYLPVLLPRCFQCTFVYCATLFLIENSGRGGHGVDFRAANPIGFEHRVTKGTWWFSHVLLFSKGGVKKLCRRNQWVFKRGYLCLARFKVLLHLVHHHHHHHHHLL